MTTDYFQEKEQLTCQLLAALKVRYGEFEELLARFSDHWTFEDRIYRFYHHSFKVFHLQDYTLEIVDALRSLLPGRDLNSDFLIILEEGTGKTFTLEDNGRWLEVARPIVEAFFHARYFLEMAVRYGRELNDPPHVLPSGWAGFLYLFNLR